MKEYFNLPFTKLTIWKSAHALSVRVYSETSKFPKSEKFGLTSQLRRASVSVVLCIAEGTGRYHHKEVIKFLLEARGSIREVQAGFLIGIDLGYADIKRIKSILEEYTILEKQLNQFIRYRRTKVK